MSGIELWIYDCECHKSQTGVSLPILFLLACVC